MLLQDMNNSLASVNFVVKTLTSDLLCYLCSEY